jgi:mycobactin lysine-N-oxygenase
MSSIKPLLVIGAGPKGIALGAKRFFLKNSTIPKCKIIERTEVGAYWLGPLYTDGKQRLVTPPEHDVGFPYKSADFFGDEPEIVKSIQTVSWSAYLAITGKSVERLHDHNRPTHKEFVEYLRWVKVQTALDITIADVQEISSVADEWSLKLSTGSEITGSGLVITGHGGPKRLGGKGYSNPRIADGRNFWDRLGNIGRWIQDDSVIGVVGSGETAGTIALAILREIEKKQPRKKKVQLWLIGKQPSYYLRSDVSKDVKHFSDPLEYLTLTHPERLGIIQRADRGVVSGSVKRQLEESECVRYVTAGVEWATKQVPRSGPIELKLNYAFRNEVFDDSRQRFDFLVFAWGFDDLWFLQRMEEKSRNSFLDKIYSRQTEQSLTELGAAIKKVLALKDTPPRTQLLSRLSENYHKGDINSWLSRRLQYEIGANLSIKEFSPRLFLPRLAGLEQGPGFPNLNCLGLLSDRIWAAYLPHPPLLANPAP